MTARFLPVALATTLILSACSSTAPTTTASSATPDASSTARSTEELEAIYWARVEEGKTRFVQADVDFMTGMIGHHAQALVMSAWAPTNGASPAVQRLAARIINAQKDEIALMQRWLRDRGQPVPLVHIEGSTLMIHMEEPEGGMTHEGMDHGDASSMDHGGHDMGGHDHMTMPGMLSQAQMDELEAARGVEFDRLFLKYMIQHHGGAIVMVDELFAQDGAGNDEASFKLASDVQVDQRTEIARMQQMLDALPDPIP